MILETLRKSRKAILAIVAAIIALAAFLWGWSVFHSVYLNVDRRVSELMMVFDPSINPTYQVELGKIPTQYLNTCFDKWMPLYLSDFYIASSYRPYQPGGNTYDVVSLKALKAVLEKGARCCFFDVWSSNPIGFIDPDAEPIVRNKTRLPKSDFQSLPFEDCMKVIADNAWSGNKLPFILYLNFHQLAAKNKWVVQKVAKTLFTLFGARLINKKYGFARYSAGRIPVIDTMDRIVILTNDYPLEGTMNELINGVVGPTNQQSGTFLLYDQDHFQYGGVKSKHVQTDQLVELNKTSLSVVVPFSPHKPHNLYDPRSDVPNINFMDPFKYGFSIVCMNYQCYDENMKKYIKFFKDAPFVVKPCCKSPDELKKGEKEDSRCPMFRKEFKEPNMCLRKIPCPKTKIDKQNPNASFAKRTMNYKPGWMVYNI